MIFEVTSALLLSFIDTDGVVDAIIKEAARAPEVNFCVRCLWLDTGVRNTGLEVAHEPTRDVSLHIDQLGDVFVEPAFPQWSE